MEKTLVLAKTAKGIEEIQTRVNGLPQKLRTLLIMVDGQKTAGTLLDRFGGSGEIEASLDELVAKGFVEIAEASAAAVPAETQREETYAEALSGLCRLVYEYLGPDADIFTGPLESARTRAEFVMASERAMQAVRGRAGAPKAERVAEREAFILTRYFPG